VDILQVSWSSDEVFDKLHNVVCSEGEVFGRDGYRRYREDIELGGVGQAGVGAVQCSDVFNIFNL